jgi:hypothetical protein
MEFMVMYIMGCRGEIAMHRTDSGTQRFYHEKPSSSGWRVVPLNLFGALSMSVYPAVFMLGIRQMSALTAPPKVVHCWTF